jgi:hypothetical protein
LCFHLLVVKPVPSLHPPLYQVHPLKQVVTFFYLLNLQRLKPSIPTGNNTRRKNEHKITSLWKFRLTRSSKLRENDDRKNNFVRQVCVLSDRNKRLLAKKYFIILVRNYLFLKIYVTLEGGVSHNVLYYQQLLNAHCQVSF